MFAQQDNEDGGEDIVLDILGVLNDGIGNQEDTSDVLKALRQQQRSFSEVGQEVLSVSFEWVSGDAAQFESSLDLSSLGDGVFQKGNVLSLLDFHHVFR